MADTLTNFTDFILKPSAPFAAGVGLFAIVWGCFKGVESVLTDDTKLEIAVWLLGRKPLGPKMEPWPDTFARVFDRVFGTKHLSWKCFWRSCIASYCAVAVICALQAISNGFSWRRAVVFVLICGSVGNLVPDYVSLLETRLALRVISKASSGFVILAALVIDAGCTAVIGLVGAEAASLLYDTAYEHWIGNHMDYSTIYPAISVTVDNIFAGHLLEFNYSIWFCAAFFTSIWLWLYAGSGFLLKFARRFDLGFEWFNRKFDIEKKPLQCIGLVAGALVAVVYWAAVIVGRWV